MSGVRDHIDEAKAESKTGNAQPSPIDDPRAQFELRQRIDTRGQPQFAPAGQSTQLVVGATDTDDAAILQLADSLYSGERLRRVYYSAFSPIPDASPGLPPVAAPLVREHRLYQADWLMRFYGFTVADITPPTVRSLDLNVDPKLAFALRNRAMFPVDLNRAPREMLLKIPGLGVRSVDRILSARRWRKVRVADLARIRVPLVRVLPFVETIDHVPRGVQSPDHALLQDVIAPANQLDMFALAHSALHGEV
jgi:predicted DNA-binding helix-hairpin-helix protein